jgi:predicted AAA+ superfamily ATPase
MGDVSVLVREFLDCKGIESAGALSTKKRLLVQKAFGEYWETGGFPEDACFLFTVRIFDPSLARSNTNLKTRAIVTRNEDERIEAGGGTIEVVPAWRFLLELPESTE